MFASTLSTNTATGPLAAARVSGNEDATSASAASRSVATRAGTQAAGLDAPSGEHIVIARDLGLKTPLGSPYQDVNLAIGRGQVFALRGRNGSGKTALLLTIAGRMASTKGELEVLGYQLPRHMGKVQKRVGLAFFSGLNEPSDAEHVRRCIAAEFELNGRVPSKDAVANYLIDWHLDGMAEKRVGQLDEQMTVRLGVALAWVGHPDIIVVDDIEDGMTKSQSIEIMDRLHLQARQRNVTFVVGVLERDLAAMADAAYYMGGE